MLVTQSTSRAVTVLVDCEANLELQWNSTSTYCGCLKIDLKTEIGELGSVGLGRQVEISFSRRYSSQTPPLPQETDQDNGLHILLPISCYLASNAKVISF